MVTGEVSAPSPAEEVKAGESVSFKIPGLPPSVNSLYQIIYSQRRVEMKPEVRLWKTRSKMYVPSWKVEPMQPLEITLAFHGDWFFKNAAFRKLDLQNLIKVVCDCVAEKIGFNDCQFFRFGAVKVQDAKECVQVTLTKL